MDTLQQQLAIHEREMREIKRDTDIAVDELQTITPWTRIIKLSRLNVIAQEFGPAADRIRDYLAGPQTFGGLCKLLDETTVVRVSITKRMNDVNAEL